MKTVSTVSMAFEGLRETLGMFLKNEAGKMEI